MPRRKPAPIHPGEILREEFLAPLAISQYRLAKDTSVPPRRINEIVRGSRAISADTALRLAHYFGTSERFWLNLQARYDLEVEKARLGGRLRREVKVLSEARAADAAHGTLSGPNRITRRKGPDSDHG
jgi:antitoxin HigA-1